MAAAVLLDESLFLKGWVFFGDSHLECELDNGSVSPGSFK